jgi:hypothetical protein
MAFFFVLLLFVSSSICGGQTLIADIAMIIRSKGGPE